MSNLVLRDYLDAGVHFGHRTRFWNPKMRPYIWGEKNGVHIINLYKTAQQLITATRFLSTQASRGKKILFVGTKRSASEIIAEEAVRAGQFYVNNRWLGGTLTNFKTIKSSVDRLIKMERERDEGRLENRTKKERLDHERKIAKMVRSLGGIKTMKNLPDMLFVVDPRREHIAVKEANLLGIPVVALCDTNCDPSGINYVIPGNDDAIKSIQLFTRAIADSALDGASTPQESVVASRSGAPDGVEIVEI